MADLTIEFPSTEDEERARAFTVHLNYVSSLASFLLDRYGPEPRLVQNLLAAQRCLPGFRRVQARRLLQGGAIGRFLRISWASELQLRLGAAGERTTLRYSNVWAPVHAYYAMYMSLQSWFAANKMGHLVDDHSSSLRTISNHISSRAFFPDPWRVTCDGCPQLGQVVFHGVPTDEDPRRRIEVLARPSPDTFWPRFCKMLETTRAIRLERNFREWKRRNGRKAMHRWEKQDVSEDLVPTTVFDFCWRLRIRSNYRDVTIFFSPSVSDRQHQEFRDSLIALSNCTCALIESLVVAAGARSLYEAAAEGFLRDAGAAVGDTLNFLTLRQKAILN
ncbi:MAG: hypothetical protein IH959_05375 [Chloroflexi bacterium]|nr:hypothetical protein [Chloroflexota bacterium]